MKPENIISAAQARLNFVDKDYSDLYKDINNKITEASRTRTNILVNTDAHYSLINRVVNDLKDQGFDAYAFHELDKESLTISVSW